MKPGLHQKILAGLLLGGAAGVACNVLAADARWLAAVNTYVAGPVGQIFLRMLFMVVVPLVFASLTVGVALLGDLRRVGRVGAKTIGYFLVTTAAACVIGLVLVNQFEPGGGLDPTTRASLLETYRSEAAQRAPEAGAGFGIHTLVNIVPRNPIDAATRGDMLGVIFFSLMLGIALTLLPSDRARPLVRVLEALGDAMVAIIGIVMKIAPYGVAGLIFVVTSRFGWGILRELAVYVAVAIAGLLIHQTVSFSLLLRFLGRMSPWDFFRRAEPVMITAFSTSSSNATLPTTIKVSEEALGIPKEIAGFVLPLGATMNMNGTALFEGVTVLFVAQVFGVDLSVGEQAIVLALSVLMAVGAAGVPGGSIPLLMLVLQAVGVPGEGIALVLGVDRILDMCRTVVNVTGDMTAAVYVARTEAGLRPVPEEVEVVAAG
ncbi:MAG: dicarboxylate/amino acid:cation symporter [Gemmatimonadetes bacterium]|nr:dicarboxylate/amino acid:cation symporter [Gemmatimonadota bacterium]